MMHKPDIPLRDPYRDKRFDKPVVQPTLGNAFPMEQHRIPVPQIERIRRAQFTALQLSLHAFNRSEPRPPSDARIFLHQGSATLQPSTPVTEP